MYINGAILHSFVYLAILSVRIQLLSLAPHGMLSTRADCLLVGFAPRTPRPVPFNYQLRTLGLINRRRLVAGAYFILRRRACYTICKTIGYATCSPTSRRYSPFRRLLESESPRVSVRFSTRSIRFDENYRRFRPR